MKWSPLGGIMLVGMLAWAQGGSNYSVFGVGDLHPSVGALYDGAASIGVALVSESGISTVNPALWTFVRSTRLQGGYRFRQQAISSPTETRAQNNGKVEGLLAIFAIDTAQGWSASIGFYPLSSVNAAVAVPIEARLPQDSLDGSYRMLATGGITVAHLGAATQLSSNFGLGVTFRYHFGLFRTERVTELHDPWSAPDTLTITDWLSGAGLAVGSWYRPLPEWLLTIALTTPVQMSTQQLWRYSFSHTYSDTTLRSELRWQLPALVAAGVAYQRERTTATIELGYSNFRSLAYRQARSVSLQPLYRISLSIHRAPRIGGRRSYWQQIGVSAGASWQQLYYRVHGHLISEYAFASGLGLPLGTAALLEIACQTGVRGKRAPQLLREWFGRFTFTLSISEQWFLPSHRR
ncbi:MAG: hypothetical protein NZ949_01750 [Candidatus Kapabacteria bacterium]|nr:hypothetical protein [Candidatus Kapabacteria bacterium]MDW7996071.1 hypothetical protein [Bacteroidota bacterium]